jgi:FecR protein
MAVGGAVGRTCVCIGLGGALVLSFFVTSAPADSQSAILDAISDRVTLAHSGQSAEEVVVERVIRSGDTVATDENGHAVVTYPDGSTAVLEENSSLTIEFVQTSAGDYIVRMEQTLGRVWYAVTRAVALGSRYEVRTAGMASVIRAGSDSYVTVSPDGTTSVVTISGAVDTSAGGAEVTVPAGSSTTISSSGATPAPIHSDAPLARPVSSPVTPSPAPTTTGTTAPPPTGSLVPAAVIPGPITSATPKTKTPTLPVSTPRPTAAPTPAATPLKDKLPKRDAPVRPSPKLNAL